jgi:hypothetical protein
MIRITRVLAACSPTLVDEVGETPSCAGLTTLEDRPWADDDGPGKPITPAPPGQAPGRVHDQSAANPSGARDAKGLRALGLHRCLPPLSAIRNTGTPLAWRRLARLAESRGAPRISLIRTSYVPAT